MAGSPYLWLRYTGPDGRYRRESSGTTRLAEARAELARRRGRSTPKRVTFAELVERYADVHDQDPSWVQSRRWVVALMVDRWGGGPVTRVDAYAVQSWLAEETARGIAPATSQRNLGSLKAILAAGHAWGMVTREHLDAVRSVKAPRGRVESVVPITTDEAYRLLDACQYTYPVSDCRDAPGYLRPLVALALATGGRVGELLRLRWADVGVGVGSAPGGVSGGVSGGVVRLASSLKGGPPREIPVDAAVVALLERGRGAARDYLFPGRHGSMSTLQRPWAIATRLAGLPGLRFHQLRHTAASWWVMDGVPLYVVASLLGHTSQRMTERYAHLAPSHPAQQVRLLSVRSSEALRAL